MAQFNDCLLIWMYHSSNLNNKINKMQERALKIVYSNYKSNFKELFEWHHSFTIHEKNIQYLATEAYQAKNVLSPVIMNNVFSLAKIIPRNLVK